VPNEPVMAWIRARVDADAPMRKSAEQRTGEPAGPGKDASPDVLMVLTRDHNQVHTLVQQLSALPGHKAGGSPEDLSRRKRKPRRRGTARPREQASRKDPA
jgi:hypothetical protein